MTFLEPPRRSRRRATAAAICTVALLTPLAGPTGPAVAKAPSGVAATHPAAAGTTGDHTVTLLTGDIVRVADIGGGKRTIDVTRPAGATGGVRTETIGDDLYVIPDEAMPYLAADRLDRRLFDVTGLIEQGYDDEHSSGIPLILGYRSPHAPTARTAPPAGTTKVRSLPAINGTSVRSVRKKARDLWTSVAPAASAAKSAAPGLSGGLTKIWLDGRVKATLKDSTAQIGAPAAWEMGYDGKGVKVAVLDTGADLNHPDLAGRVGESQSFVPDETVQDGHGHGTHTASTVGGSGAAADGAEKGVAPGADLLVGKVLSNAGWGEDSWIIAGMQWAVDHGAKVVSMSLGSSMPTDGTDPMSQAVNRLTEDSGALFVVAAGNSGGDATIGSPGAADEALTVAAVDSADKRAPFSSAGPRLGDYALKPDISAPGVGILAAKAGGSAATGWYQKMSGTSMATPHVAGAAAILAQEHPDWKAPQLKDALMSTSEELSGYTAYQVGSGRTDVAAATASTVTATGSAYFGFQAWSQDEAKPVDRTVTYRNSGDAPVELKLAMNATVAGGPYDGDATADQGKPAPEGMFSLPTDTVTVPANGSATVTATARPALGTDGRRYLGQITAKDASGELRARTRVGLYREDRRHSLDIVLKDRSGKPSAGNVTVQQLNSTAEPYSVPVDGTGRLGLRLRPGTYSVVTYLDVAGSKGADSVGMALMGDPEITLDRDREVVLDARGTREVRAEVPRRTEDRALSMNWHRADSLDAAPDALDLQYILPSKYDSMFVLPTRKVTQGLFEYETRWRKSYPILQLDDGGRPVTLMNQGNSAFYDGHRRLDVVAAGTGTAAEYAGLNVKGKIALVTRSNALNGAARAQAAADAGAALLIVVNDGPGKLLEYVGGSGGTYSKVPVASVTARAGAPLLADAKRGRLRLDVEGVPNSPYVYDLSDPHPGQIPSTALVYRPRASELATTQMRYHGTTAMAGGEGRVDFRPYRTSTFGYTMPIDIPGTRTDYISAQPGTTWAEFAVTGPKRVWESRSGFFTYKPGSHQVHNWFGAVVRPANGGGYWWPRRYGTPQFIMVAFQPWSDGGNNPAGGLGHGGSIQHGSDTTNLKIYQDGKLLKETGQLSASIAGLPATTSTYTFDLSAERDADIYRLSSRVRSVWQVKSGEADPSRIDQMAMLQLDYDVATDLAGDARGGRQSLRLTPGHLPGAVGAGKIGGTTLSVSYDDGATWKPAHLERDGTSGSWKASYDAPRHGYVSLKGEAWDDAGNRVSQEVIRAYGLK